MTISNLTKRLGNGVPTQRGGDTHQPNDVVQLAGLSAWDPIYFGKDEYGRTVQMSMVERCLLAGGLMGSGKSGLLSNILGHISQCNDARLIGIDGKQVELQLWQPIMDHMVGRDHDAAIHTLEKLIEEMDRRLQFLAAMRRRKIERGDGMDLIYLVIDELVVFTALLGDAKAQEYFTNKLMELVGLGRAVGIIVTAATQRPAAVVVPPKLRDLFAYRAAFRCSNPVSSNVILGDEWDEQGYDASKLDLSIPGLGFFLEEKGQPFRFRSAYLNDDEINTLVLRGLSIRNRLPNTRKAA